MGTKRKSKQKYKKIGLKKAEQKSRLFMIILSGYCLTFKILL